jgi:hypothetical protein
MKNKIIVWLLFRCFLLSFFSTGFASSAGIVWLSYDDGISMVEKEHKKLLISFYSDRCEHIVNSWTRKLSKTRQLSLISIKTLFLFELIPIKIEKLLRFLKSGDFPIPGLCRKPKKSLGIDSDLFPAETMIMFLKYINSDSYKTMSFKNFADAQ